jgi:hypothetical protein
MGKNKNIVFFLISFLMFNFFPLYAKEETDKNIIKITNSSEIDRTNAEIKIVLPNNFSDSGDLKILDLDKSIEFPVKRFNDGENIVILTKLDIKKGEEKELLIEPGPTKASYLTPNYSIGTNYAFVNYERAFIISASSKNKIKVLTKDEKIIDEFELEKGKLKVIQSENPQFIVLKAEKPIFVYESTLSDHSKTNLIEPGDSDTTTIFGNDIYVYTEKHLWLSSYEETEFKIYDVNNIEVYSKTLQKNSGFFIDNLNSGLYHIVANHPLTVQFGYLDDENFSYIYGKTNTINGFAFGDLIIMSKYNDTNVELIYGNTKKKLRLNEANDYEIVTLITKFGQNVPESLFFTASFSKPVIISAFSSGNNFGGEFVPGDNGIFLDDSFNFITGRISKEFSKEQKNIISVTGIDNDTEIEASKTIESKAILERFTDFYLESGISNGIISIKSSKGILVNHLRNYKDKGLFYFVPPIEDKSITVSFVILPPNKDDTFIENSVNKSELFSLIRIKEFFINIVSKDYIVFTIPFLILIFLSISGLVICISALKKEKLLTSKKIPAKDVEEINTSEENKILEEKILPKEEHKEDIPHLILTEKIKPINKSEIDNFNIEVEEKPSYDQVPKVKERERFFELNLPIKKSNFDEIKGKKIVLDPGSANRLFAEELLSEFSLPYICKSSTKKLTEDVIKLLKTADLNRMDLERARIISEKLSLTEDAGKAIILAKKINANLYVTSYRLPNKVYNLSIVRVVDLLKNL